MKKIIQQVFLLFTGFCAMKAGAQNTFPASGNVGIGTTTPAHALTLGTGNLKLPGGSFGDHGNLYFGGVTYLGQPGMRLFGGNVNGNIPAGFIDVMSTDQNDGLRIRVDNSSGGTERMRITAAGNVIVGNALAGINTPAGYRLFVEQGILTEKVKVALKNSADWADHVFNTNYPLMPLKQVETFIQTNKHLPGVPSAETLVQQGGIDMNAMFAKQMEKIEELTLYIITLNKKLEQLEATVQQQNNIQPNNQRR